MNISNRRRNDKNNDVKQWSAILLIRKKQEKIDNKVPLYITRIAKNHDSYTACWQFGGEIRSS